MLSDILLLCYAIHSEMHLDRYHQLSFNAARALLICVTPTAFANELMLFGYSSTVTFLV